MKQVSRGWVMLLVALVAIGAGCAQSPDAKKARHLERGDKYFAREKYREAIIEYRNVLRYDESNARAMRQVGMAFYNQRELGQAYPYLLKAKELEPGNIDVHLLIGAIELVRGRFKDAALEANIVLEKDPRHVEGLFLLAGAARSPGEVAAAVRRLEAAQRDLGDKATLDVALSRLYLLMGDEAGAERALQWAVTKEPKAVEARMTLADFYMSRHDTDRAEQEYKAAAELAPPGSPARIRLTDFQLLQQKPEEAKRLLAEITQKAPDYIPAWRRTAEIALKEHRYDECLKAAQVILAKNPSDFDAHLIVGRVHMARRENDKAIQTFQTVLKLEPQFAGARYLLALTNLQMGNVPQARIELKEVVTIAPGFVDATLLLAQLNLQVGAVQPAIETLEKLVATQPSLRAWELLGSAYLVKREPAKAAEAFRKLAAVAPRDPRGPFFIGLALVAEGKRADAAWEFEASLALAPDFAEPAAQLASLILADKQPDKALARIKRQIARAPTSGGLYQVLGSVYEARGEKERAEQAYTKALELDSRLVTPYVRLAVLYGGSGKEDQALKKLGEAVKASPQNPLPLTLLGGAYERKGDTAKAREAYEKALALNPRFAAAANNLAWLLSETGGNKDKALQLAQKAKEMAPDEPHISDTLGWILYKRGIYIQALTMLRDSAQKLPNNPEIQYHLGMAAFMAGDTQTSRTALEIATSSATQFSGKEEARKTLARLPLQ
jgi:tetratricopeptide (TPR) repeat protein